MLPHQRGEGQERRRLTMRKRSADAMKRGTHLTALCGILPAMWRIGWAAFLALLVSACANPFRTEDGGEAQAAKVTLFDATTVIQDAWQHIQMRDPVPHVRKILQVVPCIRLGSRVSEA